MRIRLVPLVEELHHESQCSFRPKRGTGDAIFTVKMALKKRKEHNLESWVLLIDFVKAFTQISRETLYNLKTKFGIPPKFIELIIALHRIIVQLSIDGTEA